MNADLNMLSENDNNVIKPNANILILNVFSAALLIILAIIKTVIGKDKVGIIAGVSQKLAELNMNILDVSQTIMDDYFTMMMMLSM